MKQVARVGDLVRLDPALKGTDEYEDAKMHLLSDTSYQINSVRTYKVSGEDRYLTFYEFGGFRLCGATGPWSFDLFVSANQ